MKNPMRCSASLLAITAACSAAMAAGHADHGLRFDSPGVLDLAERSTRVAAAHPVPVVALEGATAKAILAAAELDERARTIAFSEDVFHCPAESTACAHDHERQLLAAAADMVKRDGKRLVIKPTGAVPLVFVDWTQPTTPTGDGDSETHWYLGRLSGSGYQRVEVQFGHDAPGSFLVDPQSGKAAFVHNGSDVVALAPDGTRLLTFNADNSPFSLRVAALESGGARLELQCAAASDTSTAQFKGWQDAGTFDLVLRPAGIRGQQAEAVRMTRRGGNWTAATADPQRLTAAGFTCEQGR